MVTAIAISSYTNIVSEPEKNSPNPFILTATDVRTPYIGIFYIVFKFAEETGLLLYFETSMIPLRKMRNTSEKSTITHLFTFKY